jgi:uncharacterized protein YndB with AHSA1/START domain
VFSAITTQDGLAGWWTPGAKATPTRGSTATFPFGPTYFKEMEITELSPSNQLQWRCVKGCDEWVGTTISFELQAGDKESLSKSRYELSDQIEQLPYDHGTLVIFGHHGWKELSPMFAECNYTWGRFLRSLKLWCETGKGRPWPYQHRAEP